MVIARYLKGRFRTNRSIVAWLILTIFFILPWTHWNGHSVLRLDLDAKRLLLFGNIFSPQEGLFLMLLFFSLGLSLFFFTSILGRVWCAWGCPQTVLSHLFDWVGRRVLGSTYGSRNLNRNQKLILHSAWIAVSALVAFSWLGYFFDPYQTLVGAENGNLEASWIGAFGFFSLVAYSDMTWIREQFCKFACPSARFQNVLMDPDTINVIYDSGIGEPRRTAGKKVGEQGGECIACNLCLVVCPQGIDIRDGMNLACISCGQCIDACTKTMGKLGKQSLIRYTSQRKIENPKTKLRFLRPRTIVYASLLLVAYTAIAILFYLRVPFYAKVLPDRNIQPFFSGDGIVRNVYEIDLQNLSLEDREYSVQLSSDSDSSKFHLVTETGQNIKFSVPANESQIARFVLEYQPREKETARKLSLAVKSDLGGERDFVIPFRIPR